MPIDRAYFQEHHFRHLDFPCNTPVGDVLDTYRRQQGRWWWLLTTKVGDKFYVCSFGSLLPYLLGRTPHIVHNIGDCSLCGGMDPLLWRDTGALLEKALADESVCSRRLRDLPMAELPVIDGRSMETDEFDNWVFIWLRKQGLRACGVVDGDEVYGVYVARMRNETGLPDF